MNKLFHHCTLGIALIGFAMYGTSIAHAGFVFGEPVQIPPPISLPDSWDGQPALSPDELELYYTSSRDGWGLYIAQRDNTSAPFGMPTKVMDVFHPSLSIDGLTLYVNDDRSGFGEMDIFSMTRAGLDEGWSDLVNVGPNINTQQRERYASISPDGLELYFSRTVPEGNAEDIWVARRSSLSGDFELAEKLPSTVNTEGKWNVTPSLGLDGLTLLFTSDRPGGYGDFDIWYSTRQDKELPWGEAGNLGPVINSAIGDGGALVSPNGRTLYFSRSLDSDVDMDLWWAVMVPEDMLGDVNGDRAVNGLDVDPFVEVLVNGTDDNATRIVADMNRDGEVNGLDVDPFVAAVVGGVQQIPEPSTLLLCILALGAVGACQKWGG
jgi:hypothetical protein